MRAFFCEPQSEPFEQLLLSRLSLFVISSLAKKLVLECFPDKNIRGQIYRVCQKMTYQRLKQLLYLGGVKEMSLSSYVEIISNQLT